MAEPELLGTAPLDDEITPMKSTMVRRAQGDEVFRIVRSAVGSRLDVVNVNEDGVTTPGNSAASAISLMNPTANRRRNRLPRSRHCATHVGTSVRLVPDGLRIARRHLDDLALDGDTLSPRRHARAPTLLTDVDLQLVTRLPRIARRAENVPGHQQKHRIIVERTVGTPPELRDRLAKRCENQGRDLEPQHMALR
jgi:hypothetical protein